ncbi:MAG: hypothetical protein AAF479_17535 [Pseudomonadota bacterium]
MPENTDSMIIFRIVCAILMAWAVNWSLARSEAFEMLRELPDMALIGPVAAAVVGYANLAVRQGWGFIVAFANGIWAGVLSILLSGVIFMIVELVRAMNTNVIRTFDNFLGVFGSLVQPLLDSVANIPLLTVSLGATALVGVVTEVIHWALVRMRSKKGKQRAN